VVELPFAADCCPCVEKLRTVLPVPVGIRDGVIEQWSGQVSMGSLKLNGTYTLGPSCIAPDVTSSSLICAARGQRRGESVQRIGRIGISFRVGKKGAHAAVVSRGPLICPVPNPIRNFASLLASGVRFE
jgi:hypothetical protein